MQTLKKALVALAVVATLPVMAATDGVANTSLSAGTFTNSLGSPTIPTVRVFGLRDATLSNLTKTTLTGRWGTADGVQDTFCVARSDGGAVAVSFTGLNNVGSGNEAFWATNPAGAKKMYRGAFGTIATGPTQGYTWNIDHTVNVTAAQSDMNNCTNPNMIKAIYAADPIPADGTVYIDVITVTATPI